MPSKFKNLIRSLIPKKVKEFISYQEGDEYAMKVYSQEGEDILLKRIFEHSPPGFYVDVGAHHPFRFSNTKLLYDRGWRGINIEPNRNLHKEFLKHRTRDINLNIGIGLNTGMRQFYYNDKSAISTFSKEVAQNRTQLKNTDIMKVKKLSDVLDEYLQNDQQIDLMTIDVEGLDLDVLRSNNWEKYIPYVIVVEDYVFEYNGSQFSEIHSLLLSYEYLLSSRLNNTSIYTLQKNSISDD